MDGRSARPPSGNGISSLFRGRRLLDWLGERATREELATLTHLDVDAYMKYRAHSVGRRSLKDVITKIRSFLRWLHMTEQTSRDLSSTVIAPLLYALESIPSALRAEEVKEVLAVTRQDCTPKGIRDYAILMLISKYGVRSGEITTLRLAQGGHSDSPQQDWRHILSAITARSR